MKLLTATVTVGNKKMKICNKKGENRFCGVFSKGQDCDGSCGSAHKCNVMISSTRVCGGNHPATEHKGKSAKP